jgi:hypothetical protein
LIPKRAILTSLLVIALGAGTSSCSAITETLSATSSTQSQPVDLKSSAEAKKAFETFTKSVRAENNAVIKNASKKTVGASPSSSPSVKPQALNQQYPESFTSLDTASLSETSARNLMTFFIAVYSLDPNATVVVDEEDVVLSGDTATFSALKMATIGEESSEREDASSLFTMTFVDGKWLLTGFAKA